MKCGGGARSHGKLRIRAWPEGVAIPPLKLDESIIVGAPENFLVPLLPLDFSPLRQSRARRGSGAALPDCQPWVGIGTNLSVLLGFKRC